MRNLSALLFVLLLCSLQLVSSGPDLNPADCCSKLTQMKLPLKCIVSYSWTRSDCSIKAVVFKMISGKMFCVDPVSDWVNDHMKAVDQRQLVSSAPHVRNTDCCTSVTDLEIPLKKVVSYTHTDSDCAIKAVIFETLSRNLFCVNPDAVWVSSHVAALDTHNSP
ncbi:hypothetical protein P4O66_022629, partial [Electrophorus voltai]